jgi:hypothetical protein
MAERSEWRIESSPRQRAGSEACNKHKTFVLFCQGKKELHGWDGMTGYLIDDLAAG